MARAYWSCACGAQMRTEGRNRRDADSRAKWHEAQGHLCPACEEKERAAANAQAAAANAQGGLPALDGSPKQVAWAETIRNRMIPAFAEAGQKLLAGFLNDMPKALGRPATETEIREVSDAVALLVVEARDQGSAAWWIDHRDRDVFRHLHEQLAKRAAALCPTVCATERAARDAARQSAA